MDITKKIGLLNQATLESLKDLDNNDVIEKFNIMALKILEADFGFTFWKEEGNKSYKLAYKSPNTPYEPRLPRKKGYNFKVEKTNKPYMGNVKKEKLPEYDLTPYMKSIMIIPIFYKRRYGNFVLCYKKKHVFTNQEKSLAISVGNAAAQAITINRLFKNQKKFNTKLENLVQDRTAELIKDKAKDKALLASIGEGIIATDTEAKIFLVNSHAEEIFGKSKKELVGQSLLDVQPLFEENGKEVERENRPTYKLLKSGLKAKIKVKNYYVVRKDGTRIPVSITVSPIKHNGRLEGAIEVIHDIVKEKEMDKAKSELISLASHQLRTPLSAINWYAEVLLKEELGKLNPEQKRYLGEISNANKKMIELVYDFLNVSRIELGTFQVKFSELDIKETAEGVIKEVMPLILYKKIKLTEKYRPGLEKLMADKKILRIILQNLLSNAAKYTPNKGKVSMEISLKQRAKNKSSLYIEVRDNGYGIPKEHQQKIFTKLFRADNVAKMDTEGSGLGLYLVKSLVDFCQGEVWFKSSQNKGTTFFVDLPFGVWGKPAKDFKPQQETVKI